MLHAACDAVSISCTPVYLLLAERGNQGTNDSASRVWTYRDGEMHVRSMIPSMAAGL